MKTNDLSTVIWGRPESASVFERAFGLPTFRRRELDNLFGTGRLVGPPNRVWIPEVEMFERGNELVVRVDIPGLKKENINIEITEEQLIIRGERQQEKDEKREAYYRAERSYGTFSRTLSLPEGVKVDQAKAVVRDGVLEITTPLTKVEVNRRRLEIEDAPVEKTSNHAA